MNELLTTKELQEWLKISRDTVNRWREEGLPFMKIGKGVRFEKERVEDWIRSKNA